MHEGVVSLSVAGGVGSEIKAGARGQAAAMPASSGR